MKTTRTLFFILGFLVLIGFEKPKTAVASEGANPTPFDGRNSLPLFHGVYISAGNGHMPINLYDLNRLSKTNRALFDVNSPDFYSLRFIDGLNIFAYWNQVEPSDGIYTFEVMDKNLEALEQININYFKKYGYQLNLKAIIGIMPADYANPTEPPIFPPWLWEQRYNIPYIESLTKDVGMFSGCKMMKIPAPWDPNLIRKWTAVINALGAHFKEEKPQLKKMIGAVQLQALLFFNRRNNLPNNYHTEKFCTDRSGQIHQWPQDVENWARIGYTPKKIETAVKNIMQSYKTAFPGLPHIYTTSSNALPRIKDGDSENSPGVIETNNFTLNTPGALLAEGFKIFGGNLFYPEADNMSAYKTDLLINGYAEGPRHFVGYRDGWLVSIDSGCIVTGEGPEAYPRCTKASVLQDDNQQAQMSGASFILVANSDILERRYRKVNEATHDFFNSAILGQELIPLSQQAMNQAPWITRHTKIMAPTEDIAPPYGPELKRPNLGLRVQKMIEDTFHSIHAVTGNFDLEGTGNYAFHIYTGRSADDMGILSTPRPLKITLSQGSKVIVQGIFILGDETYCFVDGREVSAKLEKTDYLGRGSLSKPAHSKNPWQRIAFKFSPGKKLQGKVPITIELKMVDQVNLKNCTSIDRYKGDGVSSIYFWKPQITPIQRSVITPY